MNVQPRILASLLAATWLGCGLLGCGYIGFDGASLRDAAEPPGMDASQQPPDDAAGELDADVPEDLDASEEDAQASDAMTDADALDAGMDANMIDADADADAAGDGGGSDAGLDASDAGFDASETQDARVATRVTDYCVQVPALPNEPVIDGVVDSALSLVPLTPALWTGSSGAPLPTHTTAEYALAFRPNGLYAFIRVHDPNRVPALISDAVWRGDGVELYADNDGTYAAVPMYDNPGTIQIVVAAPENATTPSTRATRYRGGADQGPWASSRFAAFPTSDGYALEALIEADALALASWTLTSGATIGMDLGVNVSPLDSELEAGVPTDGLRLGQYFLRVGGASCGGLPFCTPAAFCTPLLID